MIFTDQIEPLPLYLVFFDSKFEFWLLRLGRAVEKVFPPKPAEPAKKSPNLRNQIIPPCNSWMSNTTIA